MDQIVQTEPNKDDIAIEVKNLCIGYKNIKAYSIKKSLLKLKKVQIDEFKAVNNVSFEVKKGEILGIIGKNGSGKSTMLKALAGIFCPDSGTIDLKGHTVSLLSIGVGFQKEVTGRENILLSGMLLGFSEEEIREKMPQIIEFAELGKFIDMPVKTYSSGMYSKLAFSITAILETEIMLIDEVLSVGDIRFKKKSFKKMRELIQDNDRTVMVVSHSVETVRKLCTRVIWLHDGKIIQDGPTEEVLDAYTAFMEETEPAKKKTRKEKLEEKMLKTMEEV